MQSKGPELDLTNLTIAFIKRIYCRWYSWSSLPKQAANGTSPGVV